jgi:hypothetical protein
VDILFRVRKRNTTLEPDNLDFVYDVEFCIDHSPDLSLSVYEIEDSADKMVQLCAEHHAAPPLDPPTRSLCHFNVRNLEPRAPVATPAESHFCFSRESHRELKFTDAAEHRQFFRRLMAEGQSRLLRVERGDMQAYIKSRFVDDDPEWLVVCEKSPKWNDLRKRMLTGI